VNANGIVFYEGPSRLNGSPVVGILTGLRLPSANVKTGPMVQAYILHAYMTPSAAIATGADAAMCGDCQHRSDRGAVGRSCYVVWWQGPTNVFRAYEQGLYDYRLVSVGDALRGHDVRLGAYGDPAAIPVERWLDVLCMADGWVGYTQQWRTCDPRFKLFLMASVQSESERLDARHRGWRTYRVREAGSPVNADEVICPASTEAGHRATCQTCQLCRGASRTAKSVVIAVHGQRAQWFTVGK
jgi:hypothetical protein